MDITMTDFKERYFNNLDQTLSRIENKVDANTSLTEQVKNHAEHTNGRVTKLEKTVYGREQRSDLKAIWKDPKVIQIALYLSLTLLLAVAALSRFDVSKVL